MPIAKKLPSGSYRCLKFAGYEYIDGKKKRKYESFTAATKEEAELLAAQWANKKTSRPENITIDDALKKYIASRENVLSPSTIRGYNASLNRFDMIKDLRIRSLKQYDVQMWVSDLSARLKPKTVKNTYGLLTAALSFVAPDTKLDIRLPAMIRKEYYMPPDEDFQKVLQTADEETWLAMMLARYYSLRIGEICALEPSDLQKNVLTIRRAMVHTKDNQWTVRERPKTDDSYRSLIITEPLLSRFKASGDKLSTLNPNSLANRFRRAVRRARVEPFNFHILRHMFATSAAMNGVPDFFTAKMGGWNQNSSVLKSVYQNIRNDDFRRQMDVMNKAMQHDLQHEPKKASKKAAK